MGKNGVVWDKWVLITIVIVFLIGIYYGYDWSKYDAKNDVPQKNETVLKNVVKSACVEYYYGYNAQCRQTPISDNYILLKKECAYFD